jgi:hypothetical protein
VQRILLRQQRLQRPVALQPLRQAQFGGQCRALRKQFGLELIPLGAQRLLLSLQLLLLCAQVFELATRRIHREFGLAQFRALPVTGLQSFREIAADAFDALLDGPQPGLRLVGVGLRRRRGAGRKRREQAQQHGGWQQRRPVVA